MNIQDLRIHQVPCLTADETLHQAGVIMQRHQTGVVPIVENNRLIGTISERDIALNCAIQDVDVHQTRILEIYQREPLSCTLGSQLTQVLALMTEFQQCWLVVTDSKKRVVGLITPMEMIQLLSEQIPDESDVPELESVKRVRGGGPAL